jgi:hypothetical protein
LSAWEGFGTSFTEVAGGAFRWRFCFASQAIPLVLLFIGSLVIPESPRWLIKVGRREEAGEIIIKVQSAGTMIRSTPAHSVNSRRSSLPLRLKRRPRA